MQNCLHSTRGIKKRRTGIRVLFLCCLIMICAFKFSEKRGESIPQTLYNTKYLTVEKSSEAEIVSNQTENEAAEKTKMNNSGLNIAKDETVSQNNSFSDIVVDDIKVLDKNGNVSVMKLENYVFGCLAGEMPLSFHPQALMAQCVAIRSFTVQKVLGTSKHKNADVCTNPSCCQYYIDPSKSGYSQKLLDKAKSCVDATKNIVCVYDSEVINAVYHASSAYNTKSSEDVWYGEVEYLKSVPSPEGEAQICIARYGESGGHGVGLSQQGANLLAGEGYSYLDILKYYYSGIGFEIISSDTTM